MAQSLFLYDFAKDYGCFLPLSEKIKPETKLKSSGLIKLAEKISKQSSIVCIVWLLVATLTQIYNEKEQADQVKIKEAPGSGMELNAVFQEINRLKKILMLNGIEGVVTPEQDATQLSFQLVERN